MKLYLKERHRLISVGGGEGDGGREGVGSEGGGLSSFRRGYLIFINLSRPIPGGCCLTNLGGPSFGGGDDRVF